ncbi:MAG: PQQ-dependent sugar dehydrogenase [Opitutaceae bacterium]
MRLCCLLMGCAVLASRAPAAETARTPKQYRDWAAIRDGNVGRGRALFFATDRAACAACHTIDGSGGKAGPDLLAVGDALSRRDLITAILEPSATIAVGYGATIIETKSGESFYGVIKKADNETVALMGADGVLSSVPTSAVKAQRESPTSLMPEGLHAAFTVAEFTDLVEFLASLKQPANSLSANRGIPDEITLLAKPARLRPLIPEAMRFPSTVVRQPGEVRLGLTWLGAVPGGGGAFLVGHQSGKIWLLEKTADGFAKTLFVDFADDVFSQRGPNGLLGVAFHPMFRENRRYFVKHQVADDREMATLIVERRAAPDFRTDSGEPARVIIKIPAVTQNHTGGCLQFGPDGMLYFGMGDTGPQQDPNGHAQNLALLLGKMMRIDVDRREAGLAYAIPTDNPFRERVDARPEIWAVGFREPWRFSFDSLTGDLWVGDVGQDRVEEVGIVRRGENHGWNVYEAFEPFSNLRRRAGERYTPPVAAYRRRYGNSVTGGYVYRGDESPSFNGVYVFADYTSRMIFGVTQHDRQLGAMRQIAVAPESPASFAADEQGKLYVLSYEGMIYALDLAQAVFEPAPTSVPVKTSKITWERRAFPLPESIWSVEAIDPTGEGRKKLLAMGVTRVFAIDTANWKTETIFDAKEGKLLYCVSLDANGDGANDLALGRYQVPWIEFRAAQAKDKSPLPPQPTGPDFSVAWLENPRRAGAQWPLHIVDRELNGIHGLHAADILGDRQPGLIATSINGPAFPNSVAWFSLKGPNGAVRHTVTRSGADGRPHYLDFADVNHDGRGDILLGDSGAGTFTWWERGASDSSGWTKHLIAQEKGATNIKAADLNRDGRLDAVGACGHGKGVFWFEGPNWTKHPIDADLANPHALAVGDFDGDGDLDVAVASYTTHVVRWYENDGRGNFMPQDIDTGNKQEAYDLKAVDVDGDGRTDLILAGRESKNAVVYFNRAAARAP